jgi:hypothetical protein
VLAEYLSGSPGEQVNRARQLDKDGFLGTITGLDGRANGTGHPSRMVVVTKKCQKKAVAPCGSIPILQILTGHADRRAFSGEEGGTGRR